MTHTHTHTHTYMHMCIQRYGITSIHKDTLTHRVTALKYKCSLGYQVSIVHLGDVSLFQELALDHYVLVSQTDLKSFSSKRNICRHFTLDAT